MVLKAYRVSHLQEGTAHEVRYWHSRVLGEFRLAGVTMENVQEECADGDDGLYVCECGQTFTRRQGTGRPPLQETRDQGPGKAPC